MTEPERVIWIVNADHWPRALLRAELIERGFEAIGFATVREAIDSLLQKRPDGIIVDLRGQPVRQAVRLAALGVPVVMIAGMPEIHDLPPGGRGEVLRRPVSLGAIADRIIELMGSSPHSPR